MGEVQSTFSCRLSPAVEGLLPPCDYSRQMQRLATTTASWIFMLKLFYFISDVVPCWKSYFRTFDRRRRLESEIL